MLCSHSPTAMSNTIHPLLDSELCKFAQQNCNEQPDLVLSSVTALNAWLKKSPHLKARHCNQLLVAFLRRCHYNLKETKRRIDNFYSIKSIFPEVLQERALSESLLDIYGQGVHVIPLKPTHPTGPRVIISQYSKYDPAKSNPREIFKLLFMLLEMLAIEDDNITVAGLIYVIDARDVSMEQMKQYDPFLLKKTWMLMEDCIPVKFNEIHLINMRRDGEAVFDYVTSFLPRKKSMKFLVHKKAEDLYEHIPRDGMTIEYGGHNGYQAEALKAWQHKLMQYKTYFAQDAAYGTNEKLRVGLNTSWQIGELSGMFGSFRKLQVD